MIVQEFYDVTESLFSAKAREGMIAFAGFLMSDAEDTPTEGLLKIASFTRPDASGYLTLTFIVDVSAESPRRSALHARFRRADQQALAARLGPDFEMLLEVPLDPFAAAERFHIDELNLYFRRLAGRERALLEGRVIPALGQLLDCVFEPLDWLADDPKGEPPGMVEEPGRTEASLKLRAKRWLGRA
jgi:hypothetical protein